MFKSGRCQNKGDEQIYQGSEHCWPWGGGGRSAEPRSEEPLPVTLCCLLVIKSNFEAIFFEFLLACSTK